jgi:hypothetical protein
MQSRSVRPVGRSRTAARPAAVLLGSATLFSLAACTAPGSAPSPNEDLLAASAPAGAIRGELISYTASYDDGTTRDEYFLRRLGQQAEIPLRFAREPDLPGGVIVDVWGTPEAGQPLRVQSFQVAHQPVQAVQQSLTAPDPGPNRPRTFAMVLVDIGGGLNITAEVMTQRLFGTMAMSSPSVRQYFMEASYGKQDVGGKVVGPMPFTMNGCDTRGLATALRPMVDAAIGGPSNHYLWYLGSRNSSCGWSGLASGGNPTNPSRDTWYNASAGCVVLVQEPGHNFGMRHSSSMKCPNATFVDAPQDTCTHSEYGDSYDPMGRGCRHMNAAQKAYLGWLGRCNMVSVPASGTFNLVPLELPCNGVQVLQIKMPKARPFYRSGGGGSAGVTELTHYYVEFRAPIGIDRGLGPVVQIRVSGDTRPGNMRALHTWFLDMDPASTTLDGLTATGLKTFKDPSTDLTITLDEIGPSNSYAKVTVNVPGGEGTATCLGGKNYDPADPELQQCLAAPWAPGATPPVFPDGGTGGSPGTGGTGGTAGGRDAGGAARLDAAATGGTGGAGRGPDAGAAGRGGAGGAVGGAGGGGVGTGGTGTGTGGTTGTGGAIGGAGGAGTGGAAGAGGRDPGAGGGAVTGGCNCELGGGPGGGGGAVLLAVAAAITTLRRRRRRA